MVTPPLELGPGGADLRGELCRRGGAGRPLGARRSAPGPDRAAASPRSIDAPAVCVGRAAGAPIDLAGGARRARAAPRPHRRRADGAARPRRPARARCRAARIRLAVGRWSEEVARHGAGGRGAPLERALGRPPRRGRGERGWRSRARRARWPRSRRTWPSTCRATCARPPDAAHRRARPRRLRQHRRRLVAHPRRAPRRDRPLGGAEPPRGGGGRRPAAETAPRAPLGDADPALRAALLDREGSTAAARWSASTPAAAAPSSSGRSSAGARWRARLQEDFGATVVITGGAGDAALARALGAAPRRAGHRPAGRLSVAETMAVIGAPRPVPLPGHRAHAHGLRDGHASVAVFGPSAAERYFSARALAAAGAPRGGAPRAVVRALQPHPPAARGVRGRRHPGVPADRHRRRRLLRGGRAAAAARRRP